LSTTTTIRRTLSFLAVLTAALVLRPAASAQPETSGAATFGEQVEVQLINVEVWVTDKDGNAVLGLGADDFEVREDGKKVDISNFAEVRDPAITASFQPTEAIEAPLEEPAPARPLELEDLLQEDQPGDRGEGFLAVYVDELFSAPAGREQLVDDLRTFLQLRRVPADRVLILRQDKELRVEANFGSTLGELEAALDRLEKTSTRGAQTWADERNAFRQIQQTWERIAILGGAVPEQDPCEAFPEAAFRDIQFHVELSRTRIEETLKYLSDTASYLAGLPGPKTLIYVSDGLPTTPGSDLISFVKSLCPAQGVDRNQDLYHGLNDEFRRLSRHANANRVTMYTMQASGPRNQTSASAADQRGVERTTEALSRYNSESRILQRQGLFLLADETGGRAVVNRNRFIEELEQIADDMNGYYSLAYAPPHGGDGLEHRIEVRVRDDQGRKLRVRHRPGYRDKSLDQRMFERLESTLYLNLMANPLHVSLGAGQVVPSEKNKSKVPIHVWVPVDSITFLPQRGGDQASLRVLAMARDERNRQTAFKQELYRLARPPEPAPDQRISLVFELELEQGIHVVAFGVRDEATKETSFVATSLEILPQMAAAGTGK
jgi:VWFA-related protein